MKELKEKTRAYALKNALAHEGKAQQGAVISSLFHEGLKKEDIPKNIKEISKIISEINKLSLEEQQKEFDKLKVEVSERAHREGLPELPDVPKSGVIMRLAPSPSGPLHVMHGIILSLNYNYVRKYGGKMIIRIEDTNPENIDPVAYKMIPDEANWLTKGNCEVFIQSERMEIYYKYAEELIKKNSAYVCTCSQEKFKKFSELKENCPCRNNEKKENLERWEKMMNKKGYAEGDAVLRFKTPEEFQGMQNPNPAMRDFPLARINLQKHPLQKNKYRVWPLMNLAVAVDDIEMKLTHLIRGKDHKDNSKRQEMIFKVFKKKYPWSAFLGRYNFTDMEISCSKTKEKIKSHQIKGWDDPRVPFIASLRKKYSPEAFWKMAEHIGISEVDKVINKEDFFREFDEFEKEKN